MSEEIIIKGEGDKTKKLWTGILISQCVLSPLNTRQESPDDAVEKLAERINRYGFEATRAVWAIKNNGKFEVFAGGLRLKAAEKAESKVSVLEHIGYTEDEIVALSDKDNEDDEYHTRVSPVEVWASYARLRDMGWTQERIADATGVERSTVSRRLKLHGELSDDVKESVRQELIDEGHVREVVELCVDAHLSTWLTTEEARQELIDKAIIQKRKSGGKSTKAVRKDVKAMQSLIDKVDGIYNSFQDVEKLYEFKDTKKGTTIEEKKYNARGEFLKELKKNEVRTQIDVAFYAKEIKEKISKSLREYKDFIDKKSSDADKETEKQEKMAIIRSKFLNTEGVGAIKNLEDKSVKLVFTDHPYGKGYQSNMRWMNEKKKKIEGDTEQEALKLVDGLLKEVKTKLMDDAHLLIFTDDKQLCNIRKLLVKNGYSFKGELIWVNEEHGTGDIEGSFAPQHKYVVHATQGRPIVSPRKPTVFQVVREHGASPELHPTEKPLFLLREIIESTTGKGELVIDPFAGIASTLVAAHELEREYWGCEIDKEYWEEGIARLEGLVTKDE